MATRATTTSEARARAVLSLDGGTEYNDVEQAASAGGSVTAYTSGGLAESNVRTPSAGRVVLGGARSWCTIAAS